MEAGLSQEQLMDISDVHRTQISEYERGARVPKLATLERFSRALGVPLGEFLSSD